MIVRQVGKAIIFKIYIMIINRQMIPIAVVAQMIGAYIYAKKKVKVIVEIPKENTPQMELFLKAANVAMAFHGVK